MEPPQGQREPPAAKRSNRILGLVAAVGFSIAMWAFIAIAVLGLILKVVGPKGAEEGLAAAGISMPQGFGLDNNGTDADAAAAPGSDLAEPPAPGVDGITTLDGRPLGPADGKLPEPRQPGEAAPETPAKPAPGK